MFIYSGYNQIDGEAYSHAGTSLCIYNDGGVTSFHDIKHDVPHIIWLWKIREYRGILYGVGYLETENLRLMKSRDGIEWETVSVLPIKESCSEADMAFRNDSMFMCIRQEGSGNKSFYAKSKKPFVEHHISEMNVSIASPEMFLCPDGNILLAGREYAFFKDKSDSINVSIFSINNKDSVRRLTVLNTGRLGDKGYPSFSMNEDNKIIMSYYCGTSDNALIRIATILIE